MSTHGGISVSVATPSLTIGLPCAWTDYKDAGIPFRRELKPGISSNEAYIRDLHQARDDKRWVSGWTMSLVSGIGLEAYASAYC